MESFKEYLEPVSKAAIAVQEQVRETVLRHRVSAACSRIVPAESSVYQSFFFT